MHAIAMVTTRAVVCTVQVTGEIASLWCSSSRRARFAARFATVFVSLFVLLSPCLCLVVGSLVKSTQWAKSEGTSGPRKVKARSLMFSGSQVLMHFVPKFSD